VEIAQTSAEILITDETIFKNSSVTANAWLYVREIYNFLTTIAFILTQVATLPVEYPWILR